MIKILKPGYVMRACPKCNCIFSYEEEDLTTPNLNNPYMKAIKCPWCKERLIICTKED